MPYTVPDLLLNAARHFPDAVAVRDNTEAASYQQLTERAHAHAGALARQLPPGARVALLLPRSSAAIAVYFGAHLAGLVPVVVHDQLRPRQVAHLIAHAEAGLVITDGRLRPLLRDTSIPAERILEPADLLGPESRSTTPVIGRDLAALAYTSGSTGSPKAVMLSHDNLVAGATIVADYLRLTSSDRILALLPWSFDYGLNQLLATFAAGGTIVIQRSTFPPDICRTLATTEVTGMAGVPTLWASLTNPHSPFTQQRYPSLRYLTNSGGPLHPSVSAALRAAQPHVAVYSMYGLTEAFRSTFLDPALIDTKPDSVGRAIPNSQVLAVDDTGRPCPPGVPGEVIHRGPTVALGYWRDPAATAAVFRPRPGEDAAWAEIVVYSGDLGYTDADGDLYLTGRHDEQVKVLGVRVTPTEIEAEIMASGLVAAVVIVVTPRPDNPDGPLLHAAVQPSSADFSLPQMKAFCQSELPPHMRPHQFTVVAQIPQTLHGKLDRAATSLVVHDTAAGARR
ncbi:AMP-binding protein [Cryptosporangium sp. NPDC048952]|uniref:AMP-binding protein n=1 Tax=Cryptosporangium sp. NPDC048952 TaxID=3363961 RepID=UPI00371DC606